MVTKSSIVTWIVFVLVGLFVNDISYAQEQNDSLKVELDPIEITAIHSSISAADAPLALSTFSRELSTLNGDASLSLQSIAQELPGLWVNDRQNQALGERLTIRGIGWRAAFGVRGIQVVLNDIPLTVADGQTMINIIEPAFIRRAELVRGPAAAYWGNSSGGVLYLSTKPDLKEEQNFRFRTMTGSYGTQKAEGEFSFSNPSHEINGYSSYLNSDGFRDYSASKLLRSGINGTINLTSKSQLKYQAASIYMPKAQHPSSLTDSLAEHDPTRARPSFSDSAKAGKQITQAQGGLSYILDTPAGVLNITGYGIYRDLNNPLPFGIITVNRWVGGLRATLDKNWSNFDLQVGVESKLQNDDRTEFQNIGNAKRGAVTVDQIERVWNQAFFTTATYSINKFNILAALRYDRLQFITDAPTPSQSGNRIFQSVSPSVGINYQPGNQTIFLNLSTSFEAPTTTELVNRPGGGNGFNPDLKPEQTVGLEAGIRGGNSSNTISYDFATFHLWITDLLFPYQLQSNGPTFYRNQGETRHRGVEGRVAWQISRDLKISATGTLMEAKFQKAQTIDSLSLDGKNVPGIPDFRLRSELSWSPGNFSGSVSYQTVGSYPANNLNTAYNEKYGVVDAKISYRKKIRGTFITIQPYINVNNLFNTRYNSSTVVNAFGGRYFEPGPDRNWQLGMSVQF